MELLTKADIRCCVLFGMQSSLSSIVKTTRELFGNDRTRRMMKQEDPFRCKIYQQMMYCEICLRHLDCSFNNNRSLLRKFILDHIDMSSCICESTPCIIVYGFHRSMELACQHVISHILRHHFGKYRFVLCIGKENDPVSTLLGNIKRHLNGYYTIISFDKQNLPRSASSVIDATHQGKKRKQQDLCERFAELLSLQLTSSRPPTSQKILSVMKDVDSHIMNTSSKLSTFLRNVVIIVSKNADLSDQTKAHIVEKCCVLDACYPDVGNNKIIPIILGELFRKTREFSESDA